MDGDNRPISQIFAEKAYDWTQLEAAAQLLEDTKSLIMSQRQAALGDMPVNKAEQIIKASQDWYDHIVTIVNARTAANIAKMELETIRMQANEQNSQQANARLEMKMTQ